MSAAGTDGPDTIVVPAGTHQLSNGQLVVTTPVEIVGQGARTTSVRGVPGEFRVLSVAAGVTASVTRVTLRDGQALDENGGGFLAGGIVVNRGTLTLDRVRITGGSASSGGGLANLAGTVTLTRSLVDANTATIGGGDAGGLLNFNGGTMTVRDTTLTGNTAANGGGAYHSWGDVGVNTATFERVTVAGNTAVLGGSGGVSHAPADTLRMRATIVAANTNGMGASNCVGAITSEGANLEDGTDCGLTGTGDRQQTNPLLRPLADRGGDTDVLAPASGSLAIDGAGDCTGTDQRAVTRPQGAACDAGAFEALDTSIDSGPTDVSPRQARFTFSSKDPAATFECMLSPNDTWEPCTSPYTSPALENGAQHTFAVRARIGDAIDETPASRTFVVDTIAPTVTITSGPPPVIRETNAVFAFTSSDPQARFECTHIFPDGERSTIGCESGWNPYDFVEGVHGFEIAAIDAAGNVGTASRTVRVDPAAPAPVIPTQSGAATFTFASAEPDATFECRIEGLTDFAPCTSPVSFDLGPGDYVFALRTVDTAGNRSEAGHVGVLDRRAAAPARGHTGAAADRDAGTDTEAAGGRDRGRAAGQRQDPRQAPRQHGVRRAARHRRHPGRLRGQRQERPRPAHDRAGRRQAAAAGRLLRRHLQGHADRRDARPDAQRALAPCKKQEREGGGRRKAKSRKLWGDGKGKFRTGAATARRPCAAPPGSCRTPATAR